MKVLVKKGPFFTSLKMVIKCFRGRSCWVFIGLCLVFLGLHGLAVTGGYVSYRDLNLALTRRRALMSSADHKHNKYTDIFNKDICRDDQEVFIVFLINSAPGNFVRRKRIRRTWASLRNYRGSEVRYAFFLGGMDQRVHPSVANESLIYEDLIQASSFQDNYLNMTRKTLMAMDWVLHFCPSASFVVKCDDDAMVHPKNLLEYLLQLRVEQSLHLYAGFKEKEGAHKFGKDSKWYVPPDVWPADLPYPPYIRGYFVLYSMGVVKTLYRNSFEIESKYNVSQAAHIDDVYVGLLAKDSGIVAEWLPHLYLNAPKADACESWGLIATLYDVKDDNAWQWYWDSLVKFDPVKNNCVDLRRLLYRVGL